MRVSVSGKMVDRMDELLSGTVEYCVFEKWIGFALFYASRCFESSRNCIEVDFSCLDVK